MASSSSRIRSIWSITAPSFLGGSVEGAITWIGYSFSTKKVGTLTHMVYGISRPPPRRVADADSAYTAKNTGSNLKEVERQIPFHAAASGGWAEPSTPEESGTAKVHSPPTRVI